MATYNCTNSSDSAYGAGGYGTCSTQTVGAPNTGIFSQVVDSAAFTVVAPLVVAIVIVSAVTIYFRLRPASKK